MIDVQIRHRFWSSRFFFFFCFYEYLMIFQWYMNINFASFRLKKKIFSWWWGHYWRHVSLAYIALPEWVIDKNKQADLIWCILVSGIVLICIWRVMLCESQYECKHYRLGEDIWIFVIENFMMNNGLWIDAILSEKGFSFEIQFFWWSGFILYKILTSWSQS